MDEVPIDEIIACIEKIIYDPDDGLDWYNKIPFIKTKSIDEINIVIS
jgi:hypothetical protein